MSGSARSWRAACPLPEANARDPNNLRLDRSLSAFSIPQIAQFSFVYQLPFGRHMKYGANVNGFALDALLGGWQVNGIYRVDNGLPIQLGLCGGVQRESADLRQPVSELGGVPLKWLEPAI